jgi:ADP-ribose pyrophosphatase
MKPMPRAVVLSRREIYRGRVLDIGVERVRLPSGVETDLEMIRHPGAAAIVPLTDAGEIVLLQQFRHAADGLLWEIPAGTLAPGERPLDCAHRELEEETGLRAAEMIELGFILPAPGYTDERIHLFLALGLEAAQQNLDADEVIAEVRAVPVAEVLRTIAAAELVDAKSVVAICRARARGLLPVAGAAG